MKVRLYRDEAWWVDVEVRLSIQQSALIRSTSCAQRSGSQKAKSRSPRDALVCSGERHQEATAAVLSLHVIVHASSLPSSLRQSFISFSSCSRLINTCQAH